MSKSSNQRAPTNVVPGPGTKPATTATEGAKARKFREIGEPRVNRAIKSIRLLGNLSNRSVYDPSAEDVAKMLKALRGAVQELEDRFSKGKKKSAAFSFERNPQ